MNQQTRKEAHEPSHTLPTARRPFLRHVAGLSAAGAFGLPTLTATVRAAIPGVTIEYKRCHVAFVSTASEVDGIAIYYADRDGERQAHYGINPTETAPREYEPLVVEYDADEDRTQIQLAEPKGSLVHIVAETATERTAVTNPNEGCVPTDFNSAPSASFTAEIGDSSVSVPGESATLEVDSGETVMFTSTATDPDDPERQRYSWDLDGDGSNYETTGQTAAASYTDDVTVSHRVTDDFGETSSVSLSVTIVSTSGPRLVINEIDYDQPGQDTAEFIEILNAGDADASLSNIELRLVNGFNGSVYTTFNLSNAGTVLMPGQYLVVGRSVITSSVPSDVLTITVSNSFIQNGDPDGIELLDSQSQTVLDSVAYEGSITGVGEGNSAPADTGDSSLSRCPDGADTNDNSADFVLATPTPGQANNCP